MVIKKDTTGAKQHITWFEPVCSCNYTNLKNMASTELAQRIINDSELKNITMNSLGISRLYCYLGKITFQTEYLNHYLNKERFTEQKIYFR